MHGLEAAVPGNIDNKGLVLGVLKKRWDVREEPIGVMYLSAASLPRFVCYMSLRRGIRVRGRCCS